MDKIQRENLKSRLSAASESVKRTCVLIGHARYLSKGNATCVELDQLLDEFAGQLANIREKLNHQREVLGQVPPEASA